MEGKTNTKKGIIKNVMLQHQKDWILINIKGYVKPIKRQLEAHMGYDGKNKDAKNPNKKHR
jgi:hypothetical protein